MKKKVEIKIYQQDWMPGFAAYLGNSLTTDGHAKVVLNLGSVLAMVAAKEIPKSEVPYVVAESIMHEVMHVLEEWAGVEFNETKVEALIYKYGELYAKKASSKRKPGLTKKRKKVTC